MTRRTGITTEQLRTAPAGALYIWPTDHALTYPEILAREVLGRTDLEFRSTPWLLRNGPIVSQSNVVLDHAATLRLSSKQMAEFIWTCNVLRLRGKLT